MNRDKIVVLAVAGIIAIILAMVLLGSGSRPEEQAPVAQRRAAEEPAPTTRWEDVDALLEAVRNGQGRPAPPPAPSAGEAAREDAGPPPEGATGGATYTVRRGDTFERIARRLLGSGRRAAAIAAANPGVDPRRLQVGQKLRVPGAAAAPATAAAPRATTEGARWHTVADGEALSTLAERYYGSSARWREIFTANREALRSPNLVRAGLRLRIPE